MESEYSVDKLAFGLGVLLGAAGVLVRWSSLRYEGKQTWHVFPWLAASALLWFLTAPVRGVIVGGIGGAGVVGWLLLGRSKNK